MATITLGELKSIWEATKDNTYNTKQVLDAINTLVNSLDSKDYSTETTLAALKTAFDNEDFASQTTLTQLLSAINNEDFAQDATLNSVLNTLNLIKTTDGIKQIVDAVKLTAGATDLFGADNPGEVRLNSRKSSFENLVNAVILNAGDNTSATVTNASEYDTFTVTVESEAATIAYIQIRHDTGTWHDVIVEDFEYSLVVDFEIDCSEMRVVVVNAADTTNTVTVNIRKGVGR